MSQQTTHKISNAGMDKGEFFIPWQNLKFKNFELSSLEIIPEPQSVNFRGHSATMPRSKSADSLTAFRCIH